MKRWLKMLSIPIIFVLALSFFGCQSLRSEKVEPPPKVDETVSSQEIFEAELEAVKQAAQAEGALLPIYFDFDKYNLKPEGKANLDKTAAWLSQNPTVNIRIEGNCDERGTNEYNMALGERRANAAKEYLTKMPAWSGGA